MRLRFARLLNAHTNVKSILLDDHELRQLFTHVAITACYIAFCCHIATARVGLRTKNGRSESGSMEARACGGDRREL
ncbi:hypothetical protein ACET3X_007854 [Alternaria dauci]|uniref:Uncharacterized protein n=1 Tax=Alternaria dauci TaxID=48095 RepID=A0ABR3UD57_9PLEO